jgi:hypothetical protein
MAVQSISVSPQLAQVLNRAGDRTGVDFDYLLQTAIRESSLNPSARASTSSAVGLFQFIEDTWLEVLKEEGPALGYQRYAGMIERVPDGDYTIRDSGLRQEVLALREDPQMAADLAAAFTRRNGEYLQGVFGRMPSPGELYIAHFLGARGAERMFNAGLENPDQIAAELFPRQASANRAIFYDQGQPRTIRQVYRALVARHEAAPASSGFAAQQISSETPGPTALDAVTAVGETADEAVPSRFSADPSMMSFTSMFSNTPGGGNGTIAGGSTGSGPVSPFFDPLAAREQEDEPRSRFFEHPYSE